MTTGNQDRTNDLLHRINAMMRYQQTAPETAVYPHYTAPLQFGTQNPAYLALKLVGECGEYERADNIEDALSELGDVLWYVAMLCNEMTFNLPELLTHGEWLFERGQFKSQDGLLRHVSLFAEPLGKMIRDGVTDKQWLLARDGLAMVLATVAHEAQWLGFEIETVAAINQAKLQQRKEAGQLHADSRTA